jgi:hypothetical protein
MRQFDTGNIAELDIHHEAGRLLVEAQVRNVSAESKVSGQYPAADNRLAIAARISGSSSTTATVFLPFIMIFPSAPDSGPARH